MHESHGDIKDLIKERADIVQIIAEVVDLKKSGSRFLGLCPFHGEKTPSFTVNQSNQFYHCFGCGEHGDVFDFMMKYHSLDFPAAMKALAARYSISIPEKPRTLKQEREAQRKKEMFAVNRRAAELFRQTLLNAASGAAGRRYLADRGIPHEISAQFGLGYAPSVEAVGWQFFSKNLSLRERGLAEELGLVVKKDQGSFYDRFRDRLLFPIIDISGRVCGFGGRIVGDGQPKYMNSPESLVYSKSKLLLGLYQLRETIRKKAQAVVVEGNFDLISLVAHGFDNVVAPLGTAITREQLRLVKRYAEEVVLLFDGDAAGIKAAVRAVPLFLAEQIPGRVALLPSGHDPDSYVREYGAEGIQCLVDEAEPLPEFVFSHLVGVHGMTLDGKSRIVEELRPLVAAASSALQRSVIVAHFAEQLGMAAEQLAAMFEKKDSLPQQIHVPEKSALPVRLPLSFAQKQLVSFMVLHPALFPQLESQGLREYLKGSIGEVIFLQLRELLAEREDIEPEAILDVLVDKEEKELVSELLLGAAYLDDTESSEEEQEHEVQELFAWFRREALQKRAQKIMEGIHAAQRQGDVALLNQLLGEKQCVEKEMRGLQN